MITLLPFNPAAWAEEGEACSAGGRGREEAERGAGRAFRGRQSEPLE